MTITDPTTPDLISTLPAAVVTDLYADVHKGIRAELFGTTLDAASLDPADEAGRLALAARAADLAWMLDHHARHEDEVISAPMATHLPELAAQVDADHARFDGWAQRWTSLADFVGDPDCVQPRRALQALHLELASFTSAYLAHQDLEERTIMPALEAAIGPDGCLALHVAIVSSIEPPVMARFLRVMLPAMNVDDRTDVLGGMAAGAPHEAFAAVVDLAAAVTPPDEHDELIRRLGLD